MKRLTIFIASLIGLGYGAQAQELTLPFMTDVFQSSFVNPAIKPEHQVSVGFSGVGTVINDGLKLEDAIAFPDAHTTVIKKDGLLGGLRDKGNLLHTAAGADFHVRFKLQNAFYWFAMREQASASLLYPKALFQLPFEGTQPFVGKALDLTDTRFKSMHYTEYMLGMSIELKNWNIGGGLSLLKGISCASFDPTELKLEIDEKSWANTVGADVMFRCTGLPHEEGNPGKLAFKGSAMKDYLLNSFGSKNTGFALRLGATYKFDDNLTFGVSAYDLGFINWKQDLAYKLKGSFSVEPLDKLNELIRQGWGSLGTLLKDSLLQDFKNSFKFDTIVGGGDQYRTWLDPKFTLSASYKLARRTSVGLQLGATISHKFCPSVTLGVAQGLGRFFLATANISYAYGTLQNFGAGLVVKPGPLQLFVAIDNYYPLLSNSAALTLHYTSVRAGINFVFGRVSEPDGLPLR